MDKVNNFHSVFPAFFVTFPRQLSYCTNFRNILYFLPFDIDNHPFVTYNDFTKTF